MPVQHGKVAFVEKFIIIDELQGFHRIYYTNMLHIIYLKYRHFEVFNWIYYIYSVNTA